MHFQRLEDLRVDHDKTQIEIAEYLNMGRNVYWRYEKGKREVPTWAVLKLNTARARLSSSGHTSAPPPEVVIILLPLKLRAP